MPSGVLPNNVVIGIAQADVTDMERPRIQIPKRFDERWEEVLAEEQFHRAGIETNLRSRSAANARHARMSSLVRSGKSLRISVSDIPEAK
jgi:hypothetical protein